MTDITTTAPQSTARQAARKALVMIALTLVSAISMIGTSSSNAHAWGYYSTSGRTGSLTMSPMVVQGGARFSVPGVTVSRNGTVNLPSPQQASVTSELQYWNGRTWIMVDSFTQPLVIPSASTAVTSPTFQMTPRYNNIGAVTGYYRVVYVINWMAGWNPVGTAAVNGTAVVVPTLVADNRCGVTTCRAYAGYVQVL